MQPEEFAKTIDHTLLRLDATRAEIEAVCDEAATHHFAAVCVLPYWVPLVRELLEGNDVKVCAAVSFPYGVDPPRAKALAAEEAVANGANEIDVVMNVPALLAGDVLFVRNDLRVIVNAARLHTVNSGKGAVLVKVIIETCYLSHQLKQLACKVVESAGADFVKTSTGVGPGGATTRDVALLRDSLGEHVAVKASGGIRTLRQARSMLNAGAVRLGTSAGAGMMRELAEEIRL